MLIVAKKEDNLFVSYLILKFMPSGTICRSCLRFPGVKRDRGIKGVMGDLEDMENKTLH